MAIQPWSHLIYTNLTWTRLMQSHNIERITNIPLTLCTLTWPRHIKNTPRNFDGLPRTYRFRKWPLEGLVLVYKPIVMTVVMLSYIKYLGWTRGCTSRSSGPCWVYSTEYFFNGYIRSLSESSCLKLCIVKEKSFLNWYIPRYCSKNYDLLYKTT